MIARVAEIGECVEVVSGPAFKSAQFTDDPSDVPLIKGENVGQGYIEWDKSKYWPATNTEGYERFGLGAGDIVLAMDRPWITAGLKWARLRPHDPPSLLVQRVARLRAKAGLRQEYLTYVIASTQFSEYVRNIMGGTNVPHISGAQIKAFKFRLPGENEQAAIADVLSAYDDLVENNRRRIALLEEAARMLYREWFVHFRFPGHEHVKVIDGLPEGWERRTLGDVAELQLGKMLDAKKNRGELRPYLANVNVRWGGFDLADLRDMRFEEHELEKFGLVYGDIVMCEGGEPGRCAIWKTQVPGMMIQKALHRIRPSGELHYLYLYHQLSFMAKSGRLEGLFTGSTIKHLSREKLLKAKVHVPSRKLVEDFAERVSPWDAQVRTLQEMTVRSSQARDLLLPRLMNGEIAV